MNKIVLALRELAGSTHTELRQEEGGMGLTGISELDFGPGEFEL